MASKAEVLQKIQTNLPDNANPKVRTEKHREVENAIVEYATNIIKVMGVQGNTITDSRMKNRDIGLITINNSPFNMGFSKPTSGITITLDADWQIQNMDTITIFML